MVWGCEKKTRKDIKGWDIPQGLCRKKIMWKKYEIRDKQLETLQLFASESTASGFKGDNTQVTQISQKLELLLATGHSVFTNQCGGQQTDSSKQALHAQHIHKSMSIQRFISEVFCLVDRWKQAKGLVRVWVTPFISGGCWLSCH